MPAIELRKIISIILSQTFMGLLNPLFVAARFTLEFELQIKIVKASNSWSHDAYNYIFLLRTMYLWFNHEWVQKIAELKLFN